MWDFTRIKTAIKAFFSSDNKTKLLVVAGLVGMLLIMLPQFTPKKATQPEQKTGEDVFQQGYITQLEDKLQGLISKIEGVGRAQVMVTLESGIEYVYAQEEKRNTDKTQDLSQEEQVWKTYLKENVEQKYILVDSEYGKKEALVLQQLQPKIKGVVVLCEGADNVRVVETLTNVITTALRIGTNRVCVVQISE